MDVGSGNQLVATQAGPEPGEERLIWAGAGRADEIFVFDGERKIWLRHNKSVMKTRAEARDVLMETPQGRRIVLAALEGDPCGHPAAYAGASPNPVFWAVPDGRPR